MTGPDDRDQRFDAETAFHIDMQTEKNIGRGMTTKLDDLNHAVRSGVIGGAGLDVYEIEPLPADHPLWSMDNVVITPHAAGASPLRQDRAVDLFCRNLAALREGKPLESVIDKRKGY